MVGVIVCMLMPISCRRSCPYCFSCRNTVRAVALGNREAEPFVASRLRHDERVDADDFAADVDERTAGVAGIDRRVGLDVDQRRIGIDLSRHGRHEPMRQAVAQPDRAAEREHRFALPHLRVGRERQRRQLQAIDLQQRQIQLGRDADDARAERASSCPRAPSPACRRRCRAGSTIWTRCAPVTTCALVMM